MKPLVVVADPKRWPLKIPGTEIVSAYQYLSDPELAQGTGRKVFNLCRSLSYQSAGYYVSLLAEARGHRPLPSVAAIQDLKLTPLVRMVGQELDELIQSSLRRIKSEEFELSVYFGHNLASGHDRLALAIFNAYPAPLLRARFEHDQRWRLVGVRAIGLGDVPDAHRPFVIEQAERYLRRVPRKGREATTRFDLAILVDPEEKLAPSDSDAIKRFIAAGETLGIGCTLIERDSYGRIAEFDGLFIRVTTSVDHYSYRFARRAAMEGLVVLDDPRSIVRCTNKVYLAETLARHRIATPRTLILSRDNAAAGIRSLGFPCVIKQPDSSFSQGVIRIDGDLGLDERLEALFEESDLLVAQEYVPTDFDWRIGVLDGKPLFACRYGMAPGHWQIVRHNEGKEMDYGTFATVRIEDAPSDVVKLAVRAAGVMGEGLYGVDLKQVGGRAVVIEVNDNPNIDGNVEDAVLGDRLYLTIMEYFLRRFEERRS